MLKSKISASALVKQYPGPPE